MPNRKLIKSLTFVVFIVFMLLYPILSRNMYWIHILCIVFINILLTSSLRTINLTGDISLGTGGFLLVGAYGSALLAMKFGLSVWLSMLLGGLMTAVTAFLLGFAVMRTKGVYFSIMTLLVSEILRLTMWYWKDLSGGSQGLNDIPRPNAINLFGLETISFDNRFTMYYLILVIVALCLLALFRLERSLGLPWMVLKKSDVLSESIGIDVFGYRYIAFVVSCFFTGIGGALFAHYMGLLESSELGKFAMLSSIYIIIYMVVGGEGSFWGPILGAGFLTIMPEIFRPLKEYQPIFFGLLVILIMFFMRQGLVSLPHHLWMGWTRVGRHLRKYTV
jgi:branched-chain amino acid transport system permease protein